MTERERKTLEELREWDRLWARPMDVGGRGGTHHAKTLARLASAGLVEAEYNGGQRRRHYIYRISEAGREALAEVRRCCDRGGGRKPRRNHPAPAR